MLHYNQGFQYLSFKLNRPPKIMHLAVNFQKHLDQVSLQV